ncbi:MAG: hypothetical protein HUJ58_02675 [Erysipelotrichaceae bacterium]|nr:hypothetical protein [Erysipelotrichaceae bacterium]
MMGLKASDFVNSNTNFTVTFNVTDGYVNIKKKSGITVTITGANNADGHYTYNTQTQTVSGYDWTSNDALYNEEGTVDYADDEVDTVSATNAGTHYMGMRTSDFINTNTNFENVTFKITDGYMVIDKKSAKIVVANSAKVYGENDPAFTGDIQGVYPDDLDSLKPIRYYRTNTAEDVKAEPGYVGVLTCEYTKNNNYDITVEKGNFVITKAGTLVITTTSYEGDYDGSYHGVPATANVTKGTTITYSTDGGESWTTSYPRVKEVKDSVTVLVKAVNPNYEDVTEEYTLIVHQAEVTVAIKSDTKVYGQPDPDYTVTFNGIVGTDSVDYSIVREEGEAVGQYTVEARGTSDQGNYSVVFGQTTLTITPLPVVLTWSDKSFTYDKTYKTVTATVSNVVSWGEKTDDVYVKDYTGNMEINASRISSDNYVERLMANGGYRATAVYLSGADSENYTLEEGTRIRWTWEILPAKLTYKVDNKSSKIHEDLKQLTYRLVSGTVYEGDIPAEFTITTEASEDKAGKYPIELHIVEGTKDPNYDIEIIQGTYTVKKPDAVPTADDSNNLTWMFTGLWSAAALEVLMMLRRRNLKHSEA